MKLYDLKHSQFIFLRENVENQKRFEKYLSFFGKGEKNGSVARDNVGRDK